MPSKPVLITGAAGFIGSHLVDRCLSAGRRVIAVDAFTDYYDEAVKRRNIAHALEHPACTLIEADLLELDVHSLLPRVAVVFHLAGQPGVRRSWDEFRLYSRANVDVTQRLLHAARGASLERFVLASSSSIYGDAEMLPTHEMIGPRPVSPYGVTKLTAEHLAKVYWQNFAVPTISLRYFTVYGPRQRPDMAFHRLISCALAGEAFELFGDGEQTRDFTYVEDVVSGTMAAAQCGRPGCAYNIGGGSRRSMNAVLDTLGMLLGHDVARTFVNRQAGDARDTGANITLARRELGFEPAYAFAAGLEAQVAWQSSQVVAVGGAR